MGQITTKIYSKSCIYDHSVDGTTNYKSMGIAINGGESIIRIAYTIISPIICGATPVIDAGWGFMGYTNFIEFGQTVAFLNGSMGQWVYNNAWTDIRQPVGNTLDNTIGLSTQFGVDPITSGSILFNFIIMSNPM